MVSDDIDDPIFRKQSSDEFRFHSLASDVLCRNILEALIVQVKTRELVLHNIMIYFMKYLLLSVRRYCFLFKLYMLGKLCRNSIKI